MNGKNWPKTASMMRHLCKVEDHHEGDRLHYYRNYRVIHVPFQSRGHGQHTAVPNAPNKSYIDHFGC